MKVKCNKCGYVGEEAEFPHDRDFFQFLFVSGCPAGCGNHQSPGGASMRMGDNKRPFEYVTGEAEPSDPLGKVLHRAKAAS